MAEDLKGSRTSANSDSEKLALYELDSGSARDAADEEARARTTEQVDLTGDIRLDTLRDAAYWHMGDDVLLPLGATAVFMAPELSLADLTFARDGNDLVVIDPLENAARLPDIFAPGADLVAAVNTGDGLVLIGQIIDYMAANGLTELKVSNWSYAGDQIELTVIGASEPAVLYVGEGEFAAPDSPEAAALNAGADDAPEVPDPGRAPTDISATDGDFDILEMSLEGTFVGRVEADDPDAGDTLTYTLSDDAGGRFTIDPATGDIRVANASLLDFESASSHTITILATDSFGNSFSKDFTITLQDVVEALDGDEADNLLQALEGSDLVRGFGGDDTLLGGAGDDTLQGGTGADQLYGEAGDDLIQGGAGDDTIHYAAGDGIDTVEGGTGSDTLVVTGAADVAQLYRIEDAATYNARTGESRPLDHVIVTSDDGSIFIDASDIESISIIGNNPGDTVLIAGDFTLAGLTDGFEVSGIESVDASNLVSAHPVDMDANAGDGTFVGGEGDDTISGGAGADTVVLSGNWADYTIADLGGGTYQLTSKIDGEVDTIDGVETFQFADVTLPAADILNTGPDDLSIDATTISEDAAGGTVVGTVTGTDSNVADTLTYSLAVNPGGLFQIDANSGLVSLAPGASLDYDTEPTVTIRVAVTDANGATYEEDVTIDVTNINEAPVDIAAAGLSVDENAAAGTVVATLSNTDPDAGDSAAATYELIAIDGTPVSGGAGELFEIVGNEVRVRAGADIDFEADANHVIQVRVTDPGGLTRTEDFTVSVGDVNEAADDISATGLAVDENAAAGTLVATLASTDPDAGDAATHTYSLDSIDGVPVTGGAAELFEIVGNEIRVKAGADIDFEADGSHVIEVTVTDAGGLTRTESFTVTVGDETEAGTLAMGPVGGDEDTAIALNISATDLEAGAVHTITISDVPAGAALSAGVDNGDGTWTLAPGDLAGLTVTPPANSDADFTLTVTLDSDEGGDAASTSGTVTVTVDAVADAPTLVLSDASGNEDEAISLDITASLPDADGSEVLSITIDGVPAGAVLSAGVDNGDGSWTLAPDDVAGLTITPATNDDGDFTLTVSATATEGANGDIATTSDTIDVTVVSVNDNPDDISATGLAVDENAAAGTVVATLASTDPDAGDAATHSYSLLTIDGTPVSSGAGELFEIVGNEVRVKPGADIDFEADADHVIEVQVTDAGGLTRTESFTINVADLNEAATDIGVAGGTVSEDAADGTVAATLSAVDEDSGESFTYAIVDGSGNPVADSNFEIVGNEVRVKSGNSLDFESDTSHTLKVQVTDSGGNTYTEDVTINLTDVNDTAQDFTSASSANAAESSADTDVLYTATATDADTTGEAITYSLVDDAGGKFVIDANTGEVTLASGQSLDYETAISHDITVRSSDGTNTTDQTVTINVVDEADEAATDITVAGGTVAEDAADGMVAATLGAIDADAGDTFTYAIVDGSGNPVADSNFEIVGNEVRVKAGNSLDFESDTSHTIKVQVTDSGGNTYTEDVTISLSDFNDTAQVFTSAGSASASESSADTDVLYTATATDADTTGEAITYSLVDDAGGKFVIDANTGEVTLASGQSLDYETATSHDITIRSSDGTNTTDQTVTINVTDEADEAATDITVAGGTVAEAAADGTVAATLGAVDADAGDTFTYAIVDGSGNPVADSNFEIVGNEVRVKSGNSLDFESDTSHTIKVQVTDSGGNTYTEDVTINLSDINDTAQIFTSAGSANAAESSADTDVLYTAAATDADTTGEAITYSLVDDAGGKFVIDANTGEVTLASGQTLDYETATSHDITIRSSDGTNTTDQTVTINVTDEADEAATDITVAGGTVAEDAADGTVAATLGAVDADAGDTFTYAIVDGSGNPIADANFEIVGNVVRVKAGNSLDFESDTSHTIKVQVTDSGGNTYTEDVTISLSDVNDTAQVFTSAGSANASESSADTDVLYTATATDADTTGEAIAYSLVDDAGGKFVIDANTGEVTLASGQSLDYEMATSHDITIRSSDGTNTTDQTVTINVTDEADEAATDITVAGGTVAEDAADGTVAATLGAVDADAGDTFTYAIVDGSGNPIADSNFEIVGNEVRVKAGNSLDFESDTSHTIKVQVTDSGGNTYTEDVTINLSDVNDAAQVFTSAGSANASESSADTDVLYTATATDADTTGEAITYSLVEDAGGKFVIDANTGEVTLASGQTLDYETATSHDITVRSSDGTNTTDQTVTINVVDEADEGATDITVAGGSLAEDAAIGTVAATLGAIDADAGDVFTYAIVDGSGNPVLDSNFEIIGNEIRVKAGSSLDYETATSHTLKVQVTDSGGNTYTEDITIDLTDVNDTAQVFTSASSANAAESSADTDVLYTAAATDADTTGEAITYSLVDDAGGKFVIDANTGEVTLASGQSLDYETATSHDITIRSSDGTNTTDQTVTINVTDEADEAATDITVAGGAIAENAADGTVAATLGAVDADAGDTFTYAIVDGSGNPIADDNFEIVGNEVRLKAGNTLDYENATSHTIRVQVTDSGGNTYVEDVSIGVTDVNDTAQVFTSGASANAAEGSGEADVLYTAATTDADTTGEAITYSLVDDAGGKFVIDANTGEVTLASGQALDYETATSHDITIRSSDGTNTTDQTVTINVTDEVDEAPTDLQLDAGASPASQNMLHLNGSDTNDVAAASNVTWPAGDFTFEVMVNSTTLTSTGSPIVSYATAGENNAFLIMGMPNGDVDVYLMGTKYSIGGGVANEIFDGSDHRVSSSWDQSSGEFKLYVDGNLESTFTIEAGATIPTGGTLTFGQEQDSVGGGFVSSQLFEGSMGDIRLFDDIRTDQEIADNQDRPIADPASEDGLVNNWQMNEAGGVITDEAGGTDLVLSDGAFIGIRVEETVADGTVVSTLSALDPESGDSFTYALVDGAGNPVADSNFEIVGNELRIKAGASLDFENTTTYTVKIQVTDSGGNTHVEDVTIDLADINDTAQVFTSGASANAAESSSDTDVLYTAAATDADTTGEAITYSLVDDAGGLFEIDASTGEVTLASGQSLDYETATSHDITIRSSDGTNTTDKTVTINVTDEADEAATDITVAGGTVAENAADGTIAATLGAVDADAGDTFTYAIVDGSGNPVADSNFEIVGNEIRVKTGNSLDYENATSHTLKVQVTDSGGNTYTEDVTIDLGDVNDTAQVFTSGGSANAAEDASDSTVFYTATTTDADTTGEAITYSLVDDAGGKFEIDANTGQVTLASGQSLDYEDVTSYDITIRSSDGTNTTDQAVTIDVTNVNEAPTDMVFGGNESDMVKNVLRLNTDGGTNDLAKATNVDWPTGDFSFEVKLNSSGVQSNGSPIVSYAVGGDANEFSIIARDSSGGYNVDVYLNGATHTITGIADEIFDGSDHRVSVTWDQSTGQMSFYVDGTLMDTATMAAGTTLTSGGTLTFGQEQDSLGGGYDSTQVFKGTMEDIRVFGDVRTSQEIDDNKDVRFDDPGSEDAMVHNWLMNGSDSAVRDEAGDADMALSNGASTQTVLSLSSMLVARVASVSDPDAGDSFTYSMTDNTGLFAIDPNTGDVTIATYYNPGTGDYIDDNSVNSHTITVHVTDSGGNTHSEDVTIHVGSDGNDTITGGSGTDIIYGLSVSDASTTLGSNLIVNGSFEMNEVSGSGSYQDFSSITGWGRYGDRFELQEDGLDGVNTPYGDQWLELDAAGSVDGIYQDISTEAGKEYQLSFAAAQKVGHSSSTNTILVYWNGALVDTVDPSSTSFQTYSLTVTGTGGSDRLEFRETSGDNDNYGGMLDNIQLQEIITPGDSLSGGDGDDIIFGSEGNDTIAGGEGDDTIYAGAGDDRYDDAEGSNGDDTGNDYIDMGLGDDTVYSDGGNDTILGGAGNDLLVGEADSDSLIGGSGDDTLNGGAGDDTLEGGMGTDSLVGGDGSDLFVFGAGEGNDVLYGGAGGGWTDTVDLSGGGASPGVYGDDWTITFDSGGESSSTGSTVELSQDSSGTINLSDGTQIEFHDIERIIW